jgi:uncharacterized membrane protein
MTQPDAKKRLAHVVHLTLLAGVAVSGVMLLAGLILVFVQHQPRPEGLPPPFGTLVRTSLAGDGLSILHLALLLLMATPVLRVAVLALGWMLDGDRRFALVALLVLGLLAVSIGLSMPTP